MRNKEILSDPVAAFSALGMTTSQSRITALEELALKARSLKQLCRETRRQTNILSRQIGEARRDGKPVDALRVTMKEHSARLKRVEKQLRDVEDRILEFFDPGPGPRAVPKPLLDPETGNMAPEREYSETAERADRVAISLLKDEADEWNAYVSRNPAATIHHRAEWQQLLKQTYGLESNYFVARDACGNVVGILPLVRLKSRLFGDFMVSMPWFGRGGAVADRPLIERKLMQAANQHASNLGIEHIEYRDDILHEGFPVLKHKVNMVLSLPNSEEALWRGFPSKLRSQIRRSRRENTEILIGSDELVNEFYRVYTRNMRDLGSPAHSKQFVINILQRFPQQSWIIVLRLYNRPVAAGFLLGMSDTLEIPLASTIRDVNPLGMNMLLYWQVLKFAIAKGYSNFDFGRSSLDSGTYRFKKQWGAKPKQQYWHYWLGKTGSLPSLSPSNPKYTLVINVWKRLPVAFTRWLGPRIVKHLP